MNDRVYVVGYVRGMGINPTLHYSNAPLGRGTESDDLFLDGFFVTIAQFGQERPRF